MALQNGASAAPLPTPYDIAPIPYFPSSPGLREWIAFVVLGLVALLLLQTRRAGGSGKPALHAPKVIAREALSRILAEASAAQISPEAMRRALFEASLVLRRLVGAATGVPAAELTSSELQAMAESETAPLSGPARDLIRVALTLDEYKFRPVEITREQLAASVRAAATIVEQF